MTLNPRTPDGRQILARLIKTADVVIANLPPSTLVDMGLDYASLAAIKPDIILTTATAFGGPGPYAERVGFDGVAQAMSGNMYMTGDPEFQRRTSRRSSTTAPRHSPRSERLPR